MAIPNPAEANIVLPVFTVSTNRIIAITAKK
jgi:hypothetical protein